MKSVLSRGVICLFATPLLATYLLGGLSAQQPCVTAAPNVTPWPDPTPVDSSGFTGAVVADFTNDLVGHAVSVWEGRATMVLNAGYVGIPIPVSVQGLPLLNVTGITALGGDDGGDGFVVANDQGLSLYEYTSPFTSTGSFTSLSIETSDWVDAIHLHSGNLDGLGRDDIVGIKAGRGSVLWVRHEGAAFGATTELTTPLGTVFDVSTIDWDGDGLQEVAVLAQGGLAVVNPLTLQLLSLFQVPTASGALATVQLAGGATALAWVRDAALGAELKLVGPNGLSAGPVSIDIDPCSGGSSVSEVPFVVEACDYDDQPGEELVLGFDAALDDVFAVLYNLGGLTPYSTASATDYEVGQASESYGWPGIGQLDDGPEDITLVRGNGETAAFVGNAYLYAVSNAPATAADILSPETEWGLPTSGAEASARQLHLAFSILPEYDWATHMELRLYHMYSPAEGNAYEIVYYRRYPLLDPAADPDQFVVLDEMADDTFWSVQGTQVPGQEPGQDHYFPEFRFVEMSPSGLVQASRSFSGAFTLRQNGGASSFVYGVDDAFIATLEGATYDPLDGIEVNDTSDLLEESGLPTGTVVGLFFPTTRAPLDPGNLPPPVAVSAGVPAGFF